MDGPQGPHQPTPTSWLYMQHLLQQLQEHQQPPSQQQQQHQQPQQQQQQQQQHQHQQQQRPPPPHQQQQQPIRPHQEQQPLRPHQQQQQQPPRPPLNQQPPPPRPPHQHHHQLAHQPSHSQQQPPPPPHTPPHHLHSHLLHQTLPQHHQPLQMQQLPPQPHQYQHLQQQQQYKPSPPPHQQQQQQTIKPYVRTDGHSYNVESLLAGPKVDISQSSLLPTPVNLTPLLPTPVHPPPLLPTPVHPGSLLPTPLPNIKIQPDNEMMVMSFLNELEGGKKMPGNSGSLPSMVHKPMPSMGTSSFSQALAREEQSTRGHPTVLKQTGPHFVPSIPHLNLAGSTTASNTTTTTTRINHNGDTTALPIRTSTTTLLTPEVSSPQEPMSLNPVYPSTCEGSGAPIGRLERGDSASSMSQLDLGLSDDSNPLIDQLESALESDSSLQAKASPDDAVPGDTSSCSDCARDEGESAKEPSTHPQTEMFMSLLNNSSSDTTRHNPQDTQLPRQPSPSSQNQSEPEQAAKPTPPPQDTQQEAKAMDTGKQEQVTLPGTLSSPSQDTHKGEANAVTFDALDEVPELCNSSTPPQDTQKEDCRDSPIVAQIAALYTPEKTSQDTQKENMDMTPVVVHVTSLCTPRTSTEDTQEDEFEAIPTVAQEEEFEAIPTVAQEVTVSLRDTDVTPENPEEDSQAFSKDSLRHEASPVPVSPPREVSPPPKDTPESSEDVELIGETISEESLQAVTDSQPPKNLAEPDIILDSTSTATSKKNSQSSSFGMMQDGALEENSMNAELTSSPQPMDNALSEVVDIPTVYIIEPKEEQDVKSSTESLQDDVVLCSEKNNEVTPAENKKQQVVTGGQIEFRKKRVLRRKETHFFENTIVPPGKEKIMVMCYVCDSNVKITKFKHHLFFGFVRCHYCNRRLMGCKLLKEDMNNPDKSICFGSPMKTHCFSKWASDPIEHLSYYIRKDLVIKRFCAGKTKPPPVPDIVAEIYEYINKLTVLEPYGPWCYAFERCDKYIKERINAEPDAFDTKLKDLFYNPLLSQSSKLNRPMGVDGSKSLHNDGSRPATATPPPAGGSATVPSLAISQTTTAPTSKSTEVVMGKPFSIIQAEESDTQTVVLKDPASVTQWEESFDDPMEAQDDCMSDRPDDAPPTPEDTAPSTTSPLPEHLVKVRTFSSLSQSEVAQLSPKPVDKPSEKQISNSGASPPPKPVPISQTISRLQGILNSSKDVSRNSSPLRSTRTSKTATPEPTPASQSDIEFPKDSPSTTTKKSIAGTTLIRQWGTKAKVHRPSIRKSTQGESWPVKDENYLIIKYPSEVCPDVCPSCYTTFDPMRATVQCSSFLMTVKCESCKLTLFVSQDPPASHPRKKRRL